MSNLPESIWISLQETLGLVADKTKESQEVVKQRLVEAFIEEEIETTGDSQSFPGHLPGASITGSVWRIADVSWVDNVLNPQCDATEKTVESDLELWKGGLTWVDELYDERLGHLYKFDQVQVRREDVVRWLDPDEAPAGEDEARTTIKEKSKTGGKRKRERKISENAALKNRIESVIARARTRWPAPMRHPSPYAMAKALCDDEPDKKLQDYAESTVKQILGGTYPLITHLGISPLN